MACSDDLVNDSVDRQYINSSTLSGHPPLRAMATWTYLLRLINSLVASSAFDFVQVDGETPIASWRRSDRRSRNSDKKSILRRRLRLLFDRRVWLGFGRRHYYWSRWSGGGVEWGKNVGLPEVSGTKQSSVAIATVGLRSDVSQGEDLSFDFDPCSGPCMLHTPPRRAP